MAINLTKTANYSNKTVFFETDNENVLNNSATALFIHYSELINEVRIQNRDLEVVLECSTSYEKSKEIIVLAIKQCLLETTDNDFINVVCQGRHRSNSAYIKDIIKILKEQGIRCFISEEATCVLLK